MAAIGACKEWPVRRATMLPLETTEVCDVEWKAVGLKYANCWAVDEAEACVL